MKKFLIITAIIILHLNGFSQLFDATIEGGIPGMAQDLIAHYEKKGYSVVKDVEYSDRLVFLMGMMKPENRNDKWQSALLHLTKEDDSEFIQSIAIYFTPDTQSEFNQHKKRFIKKYGEPASTYNKKAVWQLHNYKYTIGVDENGVYHEIKVNKTL